MILCIGLPLVYGLNLKQFTAIMAHEMGHFSQGFGMRFSYMIRRITHYLMRIVYARDFFDAKLAAAAETKALFLFWPIIYALIFYVWLSRKILEGVCYLCVILSLYFTRQMEYDADKAEVLFGGSELFEKNCYDLKILNLASSFAVSSCRNSYSDMKLGRNFPRLIVVNRILIKHKHKEMIRQEIKESETGRFDTHPSDKDRIQHALSLKEQGLFTLEIPTKALFNNLDKIAQEATLNFYKAVIGEEELSKMKLITAEESVRDLELLVQGLDKTRQLYSFDAEYESPVFICSNDIIKSLQLDSQKEKLAKLRKQIEAASEKVRADYIKHENIESEMKWLEFLTEIIQGGVLFDLWAHYDRNETEIQINRDHSNLTEMIKPFAATLDSQRNLCKERIIIALSIIFHDPGMASEKRVLQKMKTILTTMDVLSSIHYEIMGLGKEVRIMSEAIERLEETPAAITVLKDRFDKVEKRIKRIHQKLSGFPYPFEHPKGEITIAQYIENDLPESDNLFEMYYCAENLYQKMRGLYYRCLGQIVSTTEKVEIALGFDPLPELVDEQN